MAIKTKIEMVTNHWCQPIIGLTITPSEFYKTVTEVMEERQIPDVEYSKVWWRESVFGGSEREYLRIVRNRFVYDICAAPYAGGSFISSWLCIVPFTISAWHLVGMFIGMILFFWLPPVGAFFLLCLLWSGTLWWMYSRTAVTTSIQSDILIGMTGLGPFLKMIAESKPTYYQIDTAAILQSAVQEVVMGIIDGLCEEQNLRALDDLERKPVAREFLKK